MAEVTNWPSERRNMIVFLEFVDVGRVRGVAVGEGSICIENG